MSSHRTLVTFLTVAVLFGTAFPAIKLGLAQLPPLGFAAARYTLSAVALLGYGWLAATEWLPRTDRDLVAVLAGGVLFIGGTGLTFVGQQYTTSGVAAIIVSLSPVLTVTFGWVLLPAERVTRRGLAGVVVGFAGVAIVVAPTPGAILDPAVVGKGLILLSAVVVTLGTVLVRRARPRMPIVPMTGWSMAVGATVLAGAALAVGEPLGAVRPTLPVIGVVLYLGLVAGAVGFGLFFQLLDRVGPLEANLVTYATPVVALGVGWALLDEPIHLAAIGGFLLLAGGFTLLKDREVVAELARFRGAGR